jgi:hypothetical protein
VPSARISLPASSYIDSKSSTTLSTYRITPPTLDQAAGAEKLGSYPRREFREVGSYPPLPRIDNRSRNFNSSELENLRILDINTAACE